MYFICKNDKISRKCKTLILWNTSFAIPLFWKTIVNNVPVTSSGDQGKYILPQLCLSRNLFSSHKACSIWTDSLQWGWVICAKVIGHVWSAEQRSSPSAADILRLYSILYKAAWSQIKHKSFKVAHPFFCQHKSRSLTLASLFAYPTTDFGRQASIEMPLV